MQHDVDFDHIDPIVDAPQPMQRETIQSYVGRLAAYYGYPSISCFCADFDINRFDLMSGQRQAVRHFARLTGANEAELLRWTPVRVSQGLFRLRGIDLPCDLTSFANTKQCPICARETIEANPDLPADLCLHVRGDWLGGYVDVCDRHEVMLASRRNNRGSLLLMDISETQAELFEDLEDLPVQPASLNAFEQHALAVMRGEPLPDRPFVSDLPLDRLAKISTRLGQDIAAHEGLADLDERGTRNLGFEVLAGGPAELGKKLSFMRGNGQDTQRAWAAAFHFLKQLERDKRAQVQALRAQVNDMLYGDATYASGRLIPTISPEEARSEAFVSSSEYEIAWAILIPIWARIPELDLKLAVDGQDILIRKAAADAILANHLPFVTSKQVATLLGRPHENALVLSTTLCEAGVISASFQNKRLKGMRPLFSRPTLEREIASFMASIPRVEAVPAGYVRLAQAWGFTKVDMADLLRLIANGSIKRVVAKVGMLPMASIHVDPNEILEFIFEAERPIPLMEAAKRLGVSTDVATILIKEGWLTPLIPKTMVATSRHTRLISARQIEKFRHRYLRPHEAAALSGCSTWSLQKNPKPAITFDTGGVIHRWYNRKAVLRRRA